MAKSRRARALAEAVASSFEMAGFSPADLLQGPINITDVIWEVPAIKAEAPLLGVPFHNYVDYPLSIRSELLYEFYDQGLYLLRNSPELFTTRDGYSQLRMVMPKVPSGERKLALPLPSGWPVGDHLTGARFAVDVARLFKTSSEACTAFVEEPGSYYAETRWGKVGVIDGLPTLHQETWDEPCSDVNSLLEMPRGVASASCHYDLIARLRSVLHENLERFSEFEGTDLALQALRVLADGELCKDLLECIEGMSLVTFKRRQRTKAFAEAVEVMEHWHYTDRTKISMLLEILVPTHYTLETFARKIIDPRKVLPAVLHRRVEARILATLKHERDKHARLP